MSVVNLGQPGSAVVLTPSGIRPISAVQPGDTIWGRDSWVELLEKVRVGPRPIYLVRSTAGTFVGTRDHPVFGKPGRSGVSELLNAADAKYLTSACLRPGSIEASETLPLDVMDGVVFGDGIWESTDHRKPVLLIAVSSKGGNGDLDYLAPGSQIRPLMLSQIPHPGKKLRYVVTSTLLAEELPKEHGRCIPERFRLGDPRQVRGFLRGLYSANGSVDNSEKKVDLRATSLHVTVSVAELLSSIGIRSSFIYQRVGHANPNYVNQTLQIRERESIVEFRRLVGFLQGYKNDHLANVISKTTAGSSGAYSVDAFAMIGSAIVFRLAVDSPDHAYWTGGVLASDGYDRGL